MSFKKMGFSKGIAVLPLFILIMFSLSVSFAKELVKENKGVNKIDKVVHKGAYSYNGKTLTPAKATKTQQDVIFDNTNFTGVYYSGATPPERVQDWGESPGGLVTGFQIGYATSAAQLDITILFYTGTTDDDTGSVLITFPIAGLPGSDDGTLQAIAIDLTINEGDEFELPAGPFGYAYVTPDDDGPLTAIGGQGSTDGFRVLPDESVFWFGGDPYAQFWMQITGVANVVEAPANDECTTATVVNTFPYSDTLNTRGATNNLADPQLTCNEDGLQTDGNTVWYTWTPDATATVFITTAGSNYDTAIGVFVGSCNALEEVGCADIGLADDLLFAATAGVTYFIKIGEYLGGTGGGDLVFSIQGLPSLFQGPASGSVATGVIVNTDDFDSNKPAGIISRKSDHNNFKPKIVKRDQPLIKPLAARGSNFVDDQALLPKSDGNNFINAPRLSDSFPGLDDTGFIPPDCILATGPDHVIVLVNSEIGIYDKTNGQLVKHIIGDEWYSNILPNSSICDPQIIYDHFSDRWVMLWIECGDLDPTLLISISDDSNPLGQWCSYAIPGDVNGDSERLGFFNDFPKMGLDDKAIYVMSNMFDLDAGSFEYVQIRVIGKAQLYESECGGTVTWTDLWDLRDPTSFTTTFTTVPYLSFETTSEAYFVDVEFSDPGTYLNLWTLTDPLGTPAFTAQSVPVTEFTEPEQPDQRGGSTIPFEGGGRTIRQPAFYRDGDLWVSRSVGNADGEYARAVYTRLDVATKTAEEDVAFGADGFWYFYPAVAVNSAKDLVLAFTRTGENEYASARYTGRRDSDSPGLQTSALLKAGEANYSKDYGAGRNRWGDYNGVAADPSDSRIWMFVEYAKAPSSTWGTWIGSASFQAAAGAQIVYDPDNVDFDAVFAGDTTLPAIVTVQNSGQNNLTITNIALSKGNVGFSLQGLPSLPKTLTSFAGFEFWVKFTTNVDVRATDAIVITSNDADNGTVTIPVLGKTPANLALATTSVDVTTSTSPTASFSFNIGNTGGDNLEYQIGFTGFGELVTETTPSKSVASKPAHKPKTIPGDLSSAAKFNLDLEKFVKNATPAKVAKAAQNVPASTLFQYDVSTPADEIYAFAVEFDGTNILVAGGGQLGDASDANRLLVYDINGNFIEAFDQGNGDVSGIGWRDMAYDGQFLYGLDQENRQIDQFDLAAGQPTGVTIASPAPEINLRALAYDPAADHFWLSGLGLNIFEIDRLGNIVNEFNNPDLLDIRGLGWDDVSLGGPYLWIWADSDPSCTAHLFDPVGGVFTGVTFDGVDFGNNLSAGATFTNQLPTDPPNTPVLIGLHQNVPDFDVAAAYAVPPFWLTAATPDQGEVESGSDEDIEVDIDVTGLENGQFKAGVVVGTNDFFNPVSVIEVNLTNDFISSVDGASVVPTAYSLQQNYPNPFNPETKIRYTIPEQNRVSIVVYNVLGQKVRTLLDKVQAANTHEISWDGKDDNGKLQPSGVYIIRLRAGTYGQTIKMLFVK